MKSIKGYCVLSIMAVFFVFVLFSGASYAADVIKVGVVVPLTGSFADEGTEMVRGVELMVEEVNAAGGLLGKKLEIIIGDIGAFSAEKIVSVAEKLYHRDKVDCFITMYLGGMVDIKTLGEFDVPYVHFDTSQIAADLIEKNIDKFSNVFQACPPETKYGSGILDFMARVFPRSTGYQYPNKKMALITMVRAYNDRISKVFRELVGKTDWELAVDEKTPTGTVEWGPVLTKIRQANPAIIFLNDHVPSDEVAFLRQFHENPTKSMIFIQYGPSNPAFIDLGKEKTNGIFWGTLFAGFGPTYDTWKKRYVEKYKEQPGVGTAVGTYTGSMIWVQAVKRVGNEKDYAEVCRNIREYSHNITGVTHVFNPRNQTAIVGEGLSPFLVYQVQNLKHQMVSPVRHATGKMEVPAWLK